MVGLLKVVCSDLVDIKSMPEFDILPLDGHWLNSLIKCTSVIISWMTETSLAIFLCSMIARCGSKTPMGYLAESKREMTQVALV